MTPRLIILAGPLRGATYALDAKEFYIGRDPSSQLCLNDRLVSRLDALVTVKPDRFEINDLKSANGTMRINKVFFFKGAVRLGRFTRKALSPSEFLRPPAHGR